MGEKKDDNGFLGSWGSSLSLGLGTSSVKHSSIVPNQRPTRFNDVFHLPPDARRVADRSSKTTALLRRVDVNLKPPPPPSSSPAVNRDDENGVSSPNSTVSSISGKRSERETTTGDENDAAERASCSLGSDDEDGGGGGDGDGGGGGGDTSRKKLRLSKEQGVVLEEMFKEHNTLNTQQKQALAKQLNLRPRQVEVWFQNRRARTKLKQTEVDCEYLRRCCEHLTTENRRLQKEVHELRALKLSPQFYMHMNPPTTLTMCPSCERVAVSSTSSSTLSAATGAPSMVAPPNQTTPPSGSNIHRPVPINFWATNSGSAAPFDTPISRP